MVEIKKWVLEKGKLICEWGPEEEEIYFPCQDSDGMICPYGALIEQLPVWHDKMSDEEKKLVCKHYGHVCAYHYYAEIIV
jgi:hypothetical protein